MTDNKEDADMGDKEDTELQQFCKDVGLDHTKVTNMGVKKVSELGDVLSVLEYDLTKVKNKFGVKTMVATRLIKRFKPTGNPTGTDLALCFPRPLCFPPVPPCAPPVPLVPLCFLLLTWPRVRLCVFALCCSSCPPCAAGDF